MNIMNKLVTVSRSIYFLLGFSIFTSPVVLADDYETGRSTYISGDYQRTFEILRPLTENGDPEAQKVLGIMYDYGNSVEKNPAEAFNWYLRSAKQWHSAVQYQVGSKYFVVMVHYKIIRKL